MSRFRPRSRGADYMQSPVPHLSLLLGLDIVTAGDFDFAHSEQAAKSRQDKATALARYIWERGIDGTELLALSDAVRRKLARAADITPPSTMETWNITAELLDRKNLWAVENPTHPSARPSCADEKIMWVKPPIAPW